jgi:hypothetical protein
MTGSISAFRSTVLAVLAAIAFIAAVGFIGATQPSPADGPGALARAKGDAADVNPEAEEQAEQAEERREAYEEAERQGKVTAGRPKGSAAPAAATGWAGETVV